MRFKIHSYNTNKIDTSTDGEEFLFVYKLSYDNNTKEGKLRLKTARSLPRWSQDNDKNFKTELFYFCKNHMIERLKTKNLVLEETVFIPSGTSCPIHSSKLLEPIEDSFEVDV